MRIDEAKEEEMRKEVFGQKQRVVETEATRDILKKELSNLQRKFNELQEEIRAREKEVKLIVDESRRSERKANEERRNVELALEGANNSLSELRIQLSGAEGRISALEAQLTRSEGARKDAEFKLSSVVSSLRRTIGFKPIVLLKSRANSKSPIRRKDYYHQSTSRQSPERSVSPAVDHRSISPLRFDRSVIICIFHLKYR